MDYGLLLLLKAIFFQLSLVDGDPLDHFSDFLAVTFHLVLHLNQLYVSVGISFFCYVVGAFHQVFNPARHISLATDDLFVEAGGQVLHLEETLVDQRLPLPRVDVLPDQRVRK